MKTVPKISYLKYKETDGHWTIRTLIFQDPQSLYLLDYDER